MGSKYEQSPIGTARNAWCNKPDVKYNADGLYHTELVLDTSQDIEGCSTAAEAVAYKAKIDAEVDRAFDEEVAREKAENPKFNAKGWSKYYPYIEETDEETDTPTGRIVFKFKQNAKIKLKDGGVKVFKLGIRDSKNKASDGNVFGGAIIRTLYKPRNVKLATQKQFGVRLDFSMVQLIKLAPMSGGGFDEVDQAYTGGSDETVTQEAEY